MVRDQGLLPWRTGWGIRGEQRVSGAPRPLGLSSASACAAPLLSCWPGAGCVYGAVTRGVGCELLVPGNQSATEQKQAWRVGASSFVQGPSPVHEGPEGGGLSWGLPTAISANAQISPFLTQSFPNLGVSSTPIHCHQPAFANELPPTPRHTQAASISCASGLAGLGRVAADSRSDHPQQDSR